MNVENSDIFDGQGWISVFHPNQAVWRSEVRRETPTLTDIQNLVGGHIELVCMFKKNGQDCQVYVNEEGRVHGLGVNLWGTEWVNRNFRTIDHMLVGPVVILTGSACLD